jgi:hypothetical protein
MAGPDREGEGWFSILPAWLCFLLRASTQHPMIRAIKRSAPRIEPTTMPAMAPPLNPLEPPDLALLEALDDGVAELVIAPRDVVTGNSTLSHLSSVRELTQHESVEFGELLAQYAHKLGRLFANPQLLGSFATPSMQFSLLSESAGNAQLVKSARI